MLFLVHRTDFPNQHDRMRMTTITCGMLRRHWRCGCSPTGLLHSLSFLSLPLSIHFMRWSINFLLGLPRLANGAHIPPLKQHQLFSIGNWCAPSDSRGREKLGSPGGFRWQRDLKLARKAWHQALLGRPSRPWIIGSTLQAPKAMICYDHFVRGIASEAAFSTHPLPTILRQ